MAQMVNSERSVTKPQMHSAFSELMKTKYKSFNPPRAVSAPDVPLATGRRRKGRAKAQRWCYILQLDERIELESGCSRGGGMAHPCQVEQG